MASVWKRLQRVNKRAAKFSYTASYHRIDLETSPKWKPNKLSVVWSRRSRREVTCPREWDPSLKDPLKGCVVYTVPENHTVAVTLFKDSRTNELEDKDWTFVLEDVSSHGKRRRLASCSLNMRQFASLEPAQRSLQLALDPTTHKIVAATLHLTLHSVLLREGQATDEDMQSLASLLSVNNNCDIAVLDDLDEDDYGMEDHSARQVLDIRHQMESMTQSLTSSDLATPDSVNSLRLDSRTASHDVQESLDSSPEQREETPEQVESELKERSELKSTAKDLKFDSFYKEGIKEVVFKPNTVVKRNLKPLELKSNLNTTVSLDSNDNEKDADKTPTNDADALFPTIDKDKTPVQDLLEWCQSATREYKSCRVNNLTTSFRSGLAFCAIIHRHRPDLIDFSGLQPDEADKNVRVALEASATLGISQVLTAQDVCSRPVPDRLAIMTYLFQLRAHFTGNELQVEQLGNDETESSYLVGRHDTDGSVPRELFSREVAVRRSNRDYGQRRALPSQESTESLSSERTTPQPSSPAVKDVRDILHHSRSILNKMLSPGVKPTAKWFSDPPDTEPPPTRPEKLMTRKELTDPFGSDEEDESPQNNVIQNNVSQNNVTQNNVSQNNVTQNNVSRNNSQKNASQSNGAPVAGNNESSNSLTIIEDSFADPLSSQWHSSESRTNPKTPEAKSPTTELPKPTPQLLSRHDELKERARLLLEQAKKEARDKERNRRQHLKEKEKEEKCEVNGVHNGDLSPKKPLTEEERQAVLRERARKLIADARAGIVSPSSPLSPSPLSPCRGQGTVEIISKQSVMDEIAAAGGVAQLDLLLSRDSAHSSPERKSSASPDRSDCSEDITSPQDNKRSPLQSFSAMIDRLTPDKDAPGEPRETGSYLSSELEALEREQASVDRRAALLEKQLRGVMDTAGNTHEEDRLMSQWFNLVNKKNALLRRQMQLNILEQEEDLSRRCELLARELRLSLAVDEWRKTAGQKRRERLLLQELLSAVNERDRLVQEMDEQERAIADDEEIEHNLSQVEIQRKNNCILQ